MKKLLWILAILLLLLIAFRVVTKVTKKPPLSLTQIQQQEGIPVEVMELKPGRITNSIEVTGMVASEEQTKLSSKIGGRILAINRDIGDAVQKGEKLVVMDTTSLELQRNQAQGQLEIAQNTLNQVKIQLEDARKNLNRMENLFKEGAISQRELETLQLRFHTAEEQYQSAASQVTMARDSLNLVETSIRDACIYAPFSGVIGNKIADVGEVVAPGQPVMTFYNTARLNAEVHVPEQYISMLRIGQEAEIILDAFPDAQFKGRIASIAGAPDPSNRLFNVHVNFLTRPAGLKPGLFLQGRIFTKTKENVLTVPGQAIFMEGNEDFIFIVNDGRAEKKKVVTGMTTDGSTEIVSGLSAGDRAVVFGKENLTPGCLVKVTGTGREQQ